MSPALDTLFRPSQYEIVNYRGGKMGISAVPGSGKTFTLAHLAARLVARQAQRNLVEEQEILVVTFANSAVNSLKAKIAEIVQTQRGLLPYIGYRVRTLHGLAHDIVRERPSWVGLAEDFKIVDERVSEDILRGAVDSWLRTSGESLIAAYADSSAEDSSQNLNRIRQKDMPDLARSIAGAFIKQAKDRLLTPEYLREKLNNTALELPLARMGVDVYEMYQRSLAYRGAVDFDDLVRLALMALENNPDYCKNLQRRWPYILEDEAQDSSQLQEKMLRLLSAGKNWVRVGDPNQAINTTFTTANPRYLRDFLSEGGVKAYTLSEAGRSTRPILDLANALIRWTVRDHPVVPLRSSAFYAQDILPTPPGDTSPNPPADEGAIHIFYDPQKDISPDFELKAVVESLERWLPGNPDRTVAILVPENSRGFKMSETLRERGLPYEELLRSTTATRDAAETLRSVLVYLAAPSLPASQKLLAALYRDLWWPTHLGPTVEGTKLRDLATGALSRNRTIEAYLWPAPGESATDALDFNTDNLDEPELLADLETFRLLIVRWLEALILPIDQLVLTIGQDLFTEPADIALSYKIAQLLRSYAQETSAARLPQFAEQLREISQNERRFLGFDDADLGYQPQAGRVTVATMHAAKGLEWDRVYLLAVNNYGFPSAQPYDKYISERWFVRDSLNLDAEALAQLEALANAQPYSEGEATAQARIDYAAERLRLLYVGITRAKRELVITWNTGRFADRGGKMVNQPALPLVILSEYVRGTLKV